MSTGNGTPGPDLLDRVEAISAGLAESQATDRRSFNERLAAMDERLAATQAIVDSNARAIEANSAAIAEQRAAQVANEQTITNAVLGMLDMGEGMMTRIDDLGRRMDQNNAEHNCRIEDLYRAQKHLLRRLFEEDSIDS